MLVENLLKKWIRITALIFWLLMPIAYLFYLAEGIFSILTHGISFLGDWIVNPFPDWLFFTISLTVGDFAVKSIEH